MRTSQMFPFHLVLQPFLFGTIDSLQLRITVNEWLWLTQKRTGKMVLCVCVCMSNERIFNAAMKFQLKYLMSFVDLAARMPFSTIIFAQIHTNRQTHTRAHTHERRSTITWPCYNCQTTLTIRVQRALCTMCVMWPCTQLIMKSENLGVVPCSQRRSAWLTL